MLTYAVRPPERAIRPFREECRTPPTGGHNPLACFWALGGQVPYLRVTTLCMPMSACGIPVSSSATKQSRT